MKKLINALTGDSNKPAKKATAYAIIITTAVLVVSVIVLAVSSIVFAITDAKEPDPDENAGGDENVETPVTVEYATISATELSAKLGATVSLRDNRTSVGGPNDVYYATWPSDKLLSSAQKALDSMLIAFYNSNKTSLVIDSKSASCNVPLVEDSDGATSFTLSDYNNNTTVGVALYSWIYTNAYRYGYLYDGNVFHYVGVASSTYASQNGITSYAAFMSTLKNAQGNLSVTVDNGKYEIYYLAVGAEYKVPSNLAYTVTGSESSGYIVTVNTK